MEIVVQQSVQQSKKKLMLECLQRPVTFKYHFILDRNKSLILYLIYPIFESTSFVLLPFSLQVAISMEKCCTTFGKFFVTSYFSHLQRSNLKVINLKKIE